MNQLGRPEGARRRPPLPSVPGVEDLEPIGRGGFSVVYRGRQPELGRDVAVKVITAPGTVDPTADWWRREMTAMGRLSNHPNIITAYSSGMTGEGSPYLVLPYVPGGSLHDRLLRGGPLSPDDAVSLGAKLASALSAAHAAGVLHRDVKPDNVLLSPYGEPQLTDFGIARLVDATTTAVNGLVHATIAYAAPEVLSGEPATEAADVYGLAATLHACLAGTPPFPSREEDTLVSLLARIATQPPPDLRTLGVPSALATVIEEGLAKDPHARIASAEELRRRLEGVGRALDGNRRTHLTPDPQVDEPPTSIEPAPEQASPPVLPGRRPPYRRPRRGALTALVLMGAVLAMAGVLLALGDSDDPSGPEDQGSETPIPQPSAAAPQTPVSGSGAGATGAPTAVAATATRYFEALAAGDLDAGYDMLSPAFQEAQSRASYVGFWSRAGPVEVVGEPVVDEDAGTATVPVRIAGRREEYRLTFVAGADDTWLVDGPRPS